MRSAEEECDVDGEFIRAQKVITTMFDIKVNFVLTFRLVLSVDQKIKMIVYSLFF